MPSVSSVRIPGLATGMDTDTMIKEMLKGEQSKVDKAKQKEQTTKWQQEIYREIIKDTKGFEEKYFSLSSKNSLLSSSAWSTLTVTSSNPNVITATGNAGANSMNYDFNVIKMAQEPKLSSNKTLTNESTLKELGLNLDETFAISFGKDGKGLSKEINIRTEPVYEKDDSGNDKLDDNGNKIIKEPADTIGTLINKINDSTSGEVKASYSEITGKFTIECKETGEKSKIEIKKGTPSVDVDGNTTVVYDQPSNALDFVFGVNNNSSIGENSQIEIKDKDGSVLKTINEEKNIFTIDGININVKGLGETKLTSKQEVQPVVDNMKAFVEDYNKIMDKVYDLLTEKKKVDYPPLTEAQKEDMSEEEIERWEKKAKEGILRNDSEMRKFMDDMQKSIFGDKMSILNDMGLTSHDDYNKKGQIALDEKKFIKALENNSDKVYQIFAKDDSSVLERMKSTIKDYTGGSSSIFARKAGLEKTASAVNNFYSEQLKRQEEGIKKLQRKMSERESQLYKQFANLESSMNKLNSQMSYFSQM
ncbi:flagellar filament capping protein FliD [Romboutsia sedimentorum]|uniref:Flagellar hook-associated protein 2 n=1 Tax=Romboutsia sedimentorum TaxID=1368474 RepID=A0ABT7E6Y9_9FIRM|nr:flagellar filament capping protein FliD [Romboutsia sedimentorum]MDK2562700.1 flagellar filament capping protein FliD [Romboutsia sedimentorum]